MWLWLWVWVRVRVRVRVRVKVRVRFMSCSAVDDFFLHINSFIVIVDCVGEK